MLACPACGFENAESAKFCSECGTALAHVPPARREERKVVTVIFADLVGSTARAETLDPEDVRAILLPYHERLRHELERHGGAVEKFIGDAVVGVFGAPVAHEDDPERAVRAALSIQEAIAEMNAVIPWATLLALIEPHYPKAGRGRQPLGLEKQLRIYFLQQWFNLSDPQAEDAIYDSESMRRFVGVELGDDVIPDETTILRFRHLLEQHQLTEAIFGAVQQLLEARRLLLKSGTIMDATSRCGHHGIVLQQRLALERTGRPRCDRC